MNKRYLELDSLRGLAALSVLFYHCLRIFPSLDIGAPDFVNDSDNWFINALLNTPLRIFWSGHESVILFFILSGFVLSLPYYAGKKIEYKTYILKRSIRIYIPYVIATVIAMIAAITLSKNGFSIYSDWFNRIWTYETSFSDIMNHVLFLGDYNANQFNTVIWSLVHEMRISIIFPFVMFFVLRFNWKYNISLSFALSLISFVLLKVFMPTSNTNFIITIHYTSMFIIGALLAKHIDVISNYFKKLSKSSKIIVFLIAVISYTYNGLFSNIEIIHKFLIDEYAIAVGGSLFIIIALSSDVFSKFLNLRPILFLGKISYSLYLYHTIILFSLIYIFNDVLPISIILFSVIILSLILSSIFYYLVESPSMKLGKKISNKKHTQNKAA
ncbi:O-acetyltransferase OatA [Bacillus cereus]|uniref:acyltransferase family protein n=1 Tax=Bacillus cereus TaxID=1396 RepID=UPI00122C1C75|nr:acyltransferase [Bacillus cereus]KAA1803590.1 O-acetyltransferase OatA [Bacillus cereus]